MNFLDYLPAKYGAGFTTTMPACEARAFGIPYPLPTGRLRTYGGLAITPAMVIRLTAALKASSKASASDGLRVLRSAWLEIKRKLAANNDEFLQSKAWKRLHLQAVQKHGRRCQWCGASPETGAVLNVDHVLPRRLFPDLALRLDNLHVLCGDCNEGKDHWCMCDFRKEDEVP